MYGMAPSLCLLSPRPAHKHRGRMPDQALPWYVCAAVPRMLQHRVMVWPDAVGFKDRKLSVYVATLVEMVACGGIHYHKPKDLHGFNTSLFDQALAVLGQTLSTRKQTTRLWGSKSSSPSKPQKAKKRSKWFPAMAQFREAKKEQHGGERLALKFFESIPGRSLYPRIPLLDQPSAAHPQGPVVTALSALDRTKYHVKEYKLNSNDCKSGWTSAAQRPAVDNESRHHRNAFKVAELHNTLSFYQQRGWAPTDEGKRYAGEMLHACTIR